MPRTTLAGLRAHKLRLVATALAIVLGVGFVSGTLIFGDTAKATLFDEFARSMKNVDVVVDPPDGAASVPITTPDTARGVSGVATADGRMVGDLPLLDKRGGLVTNGGTPGIALSAGSVPQLRGYGVSAGRAPVGPGEAALDADTAKSARYTLGDTITVLDRGRARRTLTLVGVVDLGAAAVPSPSRPSPRRGADRAPTGQLGRPRRAASGEGRLDGAGPHRRRDTGPPLPRQTRRRVGGLPLIQVESLADWREKITGAVDRIIAVVAGLLAFAILIALIGIVNTLSLSVFERTPESAVVRALGLTRGQLRGTLLVEALLMAVVGAVVGVPFGVLYGWITTGVMFKDNTLVMHVPVGQLAGYIAVAALAGVAAAVLPAGRAAKTSVVSAMADA